MSKKTIQLTFFAIVTAGLSILLFFVLKPYIGVVFISGVFAVAFYPLYKMLVIKFAGNEKRASLVTTFLILIFIVVPIIVVSALLLKEAVGLYNSMAFEGGAGGIVSRADVLIGRFVSLFPPGAIDSQTDVGSYARNILDWIINHFDSIFITVFGGILNFILMFISLYYLFIYGNKIKQGLITWSPLPNEYDEQFIETLRSSVDAVLRGRILVAVIQGVAVGLGFAVFGVGSPVLWGFVGGLASLIPMLGTSVVTVPAIVYLFLSGHFGAGVGMLIWGAVMVGLIDNFISAIFLKSKIKVHPLIVLFSIFGGIEVFGAIGFLVGPVAVSAFIALMKIYPSVISYKTNPSSDGPA